jgi:DNA polymerase-3 subunit delta'
MHPWNEPLLDSLKRRLTALPHALLIHGPQGVGKLALAERIAQLLLCEASEAKLRPCGACDGCRWYLAGNHPDFRRIEPEALAPPPLEMEGEPVEATARRTKPSLEIKVDQVRELAGFLNVVSHRGGRRVALVHPAEDMNANAANALLKGLEEPPASALFILVAHRPARLLPTIRSRCVALPVVVPGRELALEWLKGRGVEEAGQWLAFAGGAPLLALDLAERGELINRLLTNIDKRAQIAVDDREGLELLAETLQKYSLDQTFAALGLEPRYGTAKTRPDPASAKAWLAFAREMGPNRALARHPLNPRLFAAAMLAAMPPRP